MTYPVTIGGCEVSFVWNQDVSRRYKFRLGTIGGHPSQRELRGQATADAAIVKLLWALLPASVVADYATPEDLFCAIEPESFKGACDAIVGIYAEMNPTPEKKSTSMKSPSPESNSD